MSQSSTDVINGVYAAFGRGDIPAILATGAEDIEWRVPENLPHGGDFNGRERVGQFFEGLGEHWEDLTLDRNDLVSGGDRVLGRGPTRWSPSRHRGADRLQVSARLDRS